MEPVSNSIAISRPRDEIFEFLSDIANHANFADAYLADWRLTRVDSVGKGAGARFRMKMRFNRYPWADATIVTCERPHRLVTAGRGGKVNRVKFLTAYTLDEPQQGITRVEVTTISTPETVADKLREKAGFRGWFKRGQSRALKRLKRLMEERVTGSPRITVAGE